MDRKSLHASTSKTQRDAHRKNKTTNNTRRAGCKTHGKSNSMDRKSLHASASKTHRDAHRKNKTTNNTRKLPIEKTKQPIILEEQPAKRMEKAIAWTEKAAMPAPQKPIETPIEKTKQPITLEEPAAKRVKKVLAWFEKVGVPEPELPKIERQSGAWTAALGP